MPRRSPNDIPSVAELDRPQPPAGMAPDAAEIWNCVVGGMRATWVGPEAYQVLSRYCFAMAEATKLEDQMLATPMTDPARPRLVKMYKEMSALALSYGRSLRLAPKGNTPRDGRDDGFAYEAPGNGRHPRHRRHPQPWEL